MTPVPRRLVALAVSAVAGALLAGCTGTGAATADPSTATGAPSAGSYPVATPQPQVVATPTATAGGYQLVSAGDPVRVELPGVDLVATVSGPEVTLPTPAPGEPIADQPAPGVLTVTLVATSGQLTVPASSFLGLDEQRSPIDLGAESPQVDVSPGHPATVLLHSTFASGHTTLTWQPLGQPLVTWDFVVEID